MQREQTLPESVVKVRALRLYHNDMSVSSAKVRIVLEEKGLPWESDHINLRTGDAQKPQYLSLNPNGVVPTLVHDGRVIVESTVIGEFLDHAFPEPSLRPAVAYEAARMRLWTKQLDEGLHAATATLTLCIAVRLSHLEKPAAEFQAFLAKIPDAERRERLRLAVEKGLDSPGFAPAVRRLMRLLDEMDGTLASDPWLAGGSYSLADSAFTPYVLRLQHLGFGPFITARPHVSAWAARVFARPSFESGVRKWLNPVGVALYERRGEIAREKLLAIAG